MRPLPIISMGDSDTIRVGNLAAVFGYPVWSRELHELGNHQPRRP
jgi:hypothetical protein